jgi:CRP-like cAMP-binding protein
MNLEKYTHLAFFTGLSDEEIQLLAPFFAPQTWVAGTVVFEQGDFAEYLYLVVSGELTIRYKPEAYTSEAVCAHDSEVLRIRGADLRMLGDKNPELGKVILNRLSAIIAERQHGQQGRVNSMLANGMRQPTNN